MLHTKFLGNPCTGSGKDFEGFFIINVRGGHLCHVTQVPRTNFSAAYTLKLHTHFSFDWPSGFREEDKNMKMFAIFKGRPRRWTDGRTTDGRRSMDIL